MVIFASVCLHFICIYQLKISLRIRRREYLTYCKKFERSKSKIILRIFFLPDRSKIHFYPVRIIDKSLTFSSKFQPPSILKITIKMNISSMISKLFSIYSTTSGLFLFSKNLTFFFFKKAFNFKIA